MKRISIVSKLARHCTIGSIVAFVVSVLMISPMWKGPRFSLPHAQAALLGEFTVRDEIELGRKFRLLVVSRMNLVEDPVVTRYIRGMTDRLIKVAPPLPFPIQTAVVEHPALNAFAAPGGSLFVNSGLLLNFKTESQVAAVMAHELAHVSQRHISKRIERMQTVNLLTLAGMLAGMFLGGSLRDGAVVGSAALGQTAALSYSRQDEDEADNTGIRILTEAGWNPFGAPEAMDILAQKQWYAGGSIPAYLSTHPDVQERAESLRQRIKRTGLEEQRQDTDISFHKVQTILRARYTDPKTALEFFSTARDDCMKLLGVAVAHARLSNQKEAKNAFASALACNDNDPLILREAGHFEFKYGDPKKAGLYLQKAAALDPGDLLALFYLAEVLEEQGMVEEAVGYYKDIADKLPLDPEVRYRYGRAAGTLGNYFTAHFNLAFAAMLQNDMKQAGFHIKKAQGYARSQTQKEQLSALTDEIKIRRAIMADAKMSPFVSR